MSGEKNGQPSPSEVEQDLLEFKQVNQRLSAANREKLNWSLREIGSHKNGQQSEAGVTDPQPETPKLKEKSVEEVPERLQEYVYVVPKNIKVIELVVAQAIFKADTGAELFSKPLSELIDLVQQPDFDLSAIDRLEDEAISQVPPDLKFSAEQALSLSYRASVAHPSENNPFVLDARDNKTGRTATIKVNASPNENFLVISSPFPELGELKGLVKNTNYREWEYSGGNESAQQEAYQAMMKILSSLGFSQQEIESTPLNSDLYQLFFDRLGFWRVSALEDDRKKDTSLNFKSLIEKRNERLRVGFGELLTDEEKQKIRSPYRDIAAMTVEKTTTFTKLPVKIGLKLWFDLDMTYNSSLGRMEGDISQSKAFAFEVVISPQYTPETTDAELQELQGEVQKLLEDVGLREKKTRYYPGLFPEKWETNIGIRVLRLRNGSEIPDVLAISAMESLSHVYKMGEIGRKALYELYLKSKDNDYVVNANVQPLLIDFALLNPDGRIHQDLADIVLSAVRFKESTEKYQNLFLASPVEGD